MWRGMLDQSTDVAKLAFIRMSDFLWGLIGLLIIIVVGWLVARLVETAIAKVLKVVKLDVAAETAGVNNFLAKGGIKLTISGLIASIFYWLVLLVTAAVAVDFLDLQIVGLLLDKIILYVPNVIISIFILLLGIFVSTFLETLVRTAAANAGLVRANLISKLVGFIIIVSAITIALEQLNIGADLIVLIVKSIIISIALAAALAFGLGCKDMAADWLAETIEKLQEKK